MGMSRKNLRSASRQVIARTAGAVIEQLEGRRLLSVSAVEAYVTMNGSARSWWLRPHGLDGGGSWETVSPRETHSEPGDFPPAADQGVPIQPIFPRIEPQLLLAEAEADSAMITDNSESVVDRVPTEQHGPDPVLPRIPGIGGEGTEVPEGYSQVIALPNATTNDSVVNRVLNSAEAYVTIGLFARGPWLHLRTHAIDWDGVDVVSEIGVGDVG